MADAGDRAPSGPAGPQPLGRLGRLFVVHGWFIFIVVGLVLLLAAIVAVAAALDDPTGRLAETLPLVIAAAGFIGIIVGATAIRLVTGAATEAAELAERRLEAIERRDDDVTLTGVRLQRSNQQLDRFATIAAHDLQEPLRTMLAYVDLVRLSGADRLDAESLEHLDRVTRSGQRLRAMVRDLVQFAKAGDEPFEPTPVNLNAVLDDVIAALDSAITESHAVVEVMKLPIVPGNRTALEQVFGNLVSNAIRYRSEQVPSVRIDCVRGTGVWQVRISDNGIGIDPRYHEQVFDLFRRLDRRDDEGTGVGLALARRLLDRMGGRIAVADSHAGEGTTFVVELASFPEA